MLLVDGGDCLSNRAVLRNEPNLFGHVALDFARIYCGGTK
jgi:hypothetical protein